MDERENEVVLLDFFNVIWKRKWLILGATLFLAIAAAVISFVLPSKWEVDALLMPSRFLVQTEQGEFRRVLIAEPSEIAGQINQQSYDRLMAAELHLDIRDFPRMKAENLKNTNFVRVVVTEKDTQKAVLILSSLLQHLKGELDKKVEIETKSID